MKKQKSKIRTSTARKIFNVCNIIILTILALTCLLPFINLLAVSLSGQYAVNSNAVSFWPKDFNLKSYQFVLESGSFLQAFGITLKRVFLGVTVNLLLIIPTAYVLSQEESRFAMRRIYAWFFVITILFGAGLVPWYTVVLKTGLVNTIWALILPDAVPVFSVLVLMNYMRGIPIDLKDAAFIDGAGHVRTLVSVVIPLCKPSLATITLFAMVGHWNAWFDGLLFMDRTENYPLQSYLQTIVINPEQYLSKMRGSSSSSIRELLSFVSARSSRAAQLFVAILPIMMVYPFLQKYFATGLTMGGVKG
ncbi:MAG: carbohydrate ABC transporter permease [Lachnospiraceae bacterium]|nr:carbohydrate ABC transporter permease [Lachnospiraceae bacterium]